MEADHDSTLTEPPKRDDIAREVRDQLHSELAPMVNALTMLTDSMRVLHAISDYADGKPSFAAALNATCDAPLNPVASDDCWRTVNQRSSAISATLNRITGLAEQATARPAVASMPPVAYH